MDLERDLQDLKKSRVKIVNWSLAKEQRQCNEKNSLKTNDSGTGHLSLSHTHTYTHIHTHTHTHTHKMYLDIDLTPSTKINSKWITNLNVKCKTTELIDDNLGENRNDLGYGNEFLDIAPKAQFIREITDTLNFIKIKNSCSQKTLSSK